MAKLTFFPLGNADCCLIDLADKQKILLDFGNQRDPDNPDDKRTSTCRVKFFLAPLS